MSKSLVKLCAFVSVVCLLLACTTHQSDQEAVYDRQDTVLPSSVTRVKNPFRVSLDTMPAPVHFRLKDTGRLHDKAGLAQFTRLFINYTIEDGLPVNGFTSSLVDSDGNLWFGSNGAGVVRYDGYRFEHFSTANGISNNGIWQMAAAPSGDILFATYGGGISSFNGRSFAAFTMEDGLPSNGIYAVCTGPDGTIWLGTVENGACAVRENRVFPIASVSGMDAKSVRHIAVTSEGSVWCSTEKGLYRYASGAALRMPLQNGADDDGITCLLAVHDTLWIGTTGSGLYFFDGTSCRKYRPSEDVTFKSITALYKSDPETLWAATEKGLVLITTAGYSLLGADQGFPDVVVTSIVADKRGKIWFTTESNGVFLYKGDDYQQLDKKSQLNGNNVYTMSEDSEGRLWMGTTGSGLFCLASDRLKRFTSADGIASDQLWSMATDRKGNLWMGSIRNGVTCFDGKTFTTYTTRQGLSSDMIRSICPARNGAIWFATTGGGVNRLCNGIIEQYTTGQGLPSDVILCILEDHAGGLWFGTVGKGVSRFDGKTFTTFDTTSGLENNIVITLLEDHDGNVWIGTEGGGITRYDGRSMLTFSTSNGLPDNTVYGIDEDATGSIWIGTNKGVVKLRFEEPGTLRTVSGANLSNAALRQYRVVTEEYSRKSGYPFNDMTSGQCALLIDGSGNVWAGTGDNRYGVVKIIGKAKDTVSATAPHIRSVSVNEKPVSWYQLDTSSSSEEILNEEVITFGHRLEDQARTKNKNEFQAAVFSSIDTRHPVPLGLKLPYRLNTISIAFSAVAPGMSELTEYRYRLDGYSSGWSDPTGKTEVSYGNLREGTYTFQVSNRYDNGSWSPPTVYSFSVFPPWYRTWYMYAGYALTIAGLVIGYNRWRTRRLLSANKELERKVRARTAEVVREKENVEQEKKKSDDLLLNILPATTAEELKSTGRATPRKYDGVTVLFTDFKNFTQACERMSPSEMVEEINYCYTAFDRIIARHGLEKIKTIGDSYMCASGLPEERPDHASACVHAALEIRDFMHHERIEREKHGKPYFDIRIGLHSGPVVSGIVGERKFAYDIWGDTVNIASRMESNGETGKVNISSATRTLIGEEFACSPRGEIAVKNKGKMEMFFAEPKHRQL